MLSKGWIRALEGEADSRKKEYEITGEGRTVVLDEIKIARAHRSVKE